MKQLKKTLSCILALTIAASMYAMPVYAEEETEASVVSAVDAATEEEPVTETAAEADADGFVIECHVLVGIYR